MTVTMIVTVTEARTVTGTATAMATRIRIGIVIVIAQFPRARGARHKQTVLRRREGGQARQTRPRSCCRRRCRASRASSSSS